MTAKALHRSLQGLLLASLCACGTTAQDDSREDVSRYDVERDWEQFRAGVYREPGEHGVFIVEGDVAISDEAELRRYFDTYVSMVAQPLTVMTALGADVLWPVGDRFNLTYCISDDFGTRKTDVIEGMTLATRSWSDRVGVHFQYLPGQDANCTSANANVVFDVSPAPTGATYFARAFFPNDARAQRNVLISGDAFTTTAGGRDFQGILRHELGHTLGFRHEHIWTTTCAGESTTDARLVTEYDVNSVMHYPQCRPVNVGGYRQTDHDYRGAVSLYGLSPALILTSTSIIQ
ncbi:M57 family metalloprotease [Archangium lansingense]|uniref:M57 family metalloprotease n=1 Tax=Archangium lansingense TaxID=2995310 RepID=UPI003B7DD6FC